MTSERPSDLDLLALAEDIAADRRTLSNVIDQLNASEPDDAARREAVSELQSLVVALTAVRRHARATAEAQLGVQAGPAVAERLVVEPASVQRRSRPMQLSRASLPRLVAGVGTAILAVVVVAVVASTLRTTPAVGGPSPSPVSSMPVVSAEPSASVPATSSTPPTGSPAPATSPPATPTTAPTASASATPIPATPSPATPPPATPQPTPTSTGAYLIPPIPSEPLPGAPRVAFAWASSPTLLHLWTWDPSTSNGLEPWFDVDVNLSGVPVNDNISVLVSPDGTRVAVNEHGFTDPASRDLVRIFDSTGKLLWTSSKGASPVIDMAWSPDGTELALGSVPVPWVVLTFSPGGSIESTTYDLPGDNAYRLLGFAPDDAHLIGYESSGEADYWEKPAALDLARGTVAPIDVFPSGMQSNATKRDSGPSWPLEQINTNTGDVLARTGGAKGDPKWVVRRGTDERPLGIDPDHQAVWGTGSHTVSVGATSSTPPVIGFWNDAIGETSQPVTVMPGVAYPTLVGVRGGYALSLLRPQISTPMDLGESEALMVDLDSGRTGVAITPEPKALGGLDYAGWITSR